jgi:tetratricopeptide (TPR) repeat protein
MYSDAAVSHTKTSPKTDRNLKIYEKLITKGEKLSPRDLFLYGDELVGNGYFERAIEQYIQFLDEKTMSSEDKVEACLKISQCYHQLGNQVMEVPYLLKSFEYDIPNAEQCCRMGNHFFSNQNWKAAIFWFEIAAQMEKPKNVWGLVFQEFYTWVPHQQLAICYGKLGMLEQAYYHNEMTRLFLPDDPVVLNNKLLLEQHLNRNGEGEQA